MANLLDGPGLFRNTLIPTISQGTPAQGKRIPFSFTSTKRLINSGLLPVVGSELAKAQAATDIKTELAIIQLESTSRAAVAQLGLANYLSQAEQIANTVTPFGMPIINAQINPQTVRWEQNKRIVKRDTMNGSTFFHFTNDADQNNDILTCTFTGKTGNINTQANILDILSTGASLKLRIFHELYNLTREEMLLSKDSRGRALPRGIKNDFFITYRTMLMPVQITLIGHFSKVLEFTETAADPFNRDYSFSFTVTRTSPSLDDIAQMIADASSLTGQLNEIKDTVKDGVNAVGNVLSGTPIL